MIITWGASPRAHFGGKQINGANDCCYLNLPTIALPHPLCSQVIRFLVLCTLPSSVCSLLPLATVGVYLQARSSLLHSLLLCSQSDLLLKCALGCCYVFWFPQFSLICELNGAEVKQWGIFTEGIKTTPRSAELQQAPGATLSQLTFCDSAARAQHAGVHTFLYAHLYLWDSHCIASHFLSLQ